MSKFHFMGESAVLIERLTKSAIQGAKVDKHSLRKNVGSGSREEDFVGQFIIRNTTS